jgi:hypothetical protein
MFKIVFIVLSTLLFGINDVYSFQGLVKDIKQTSSYTYLSIENENKTVWIAVSKTKIDKGEILDVELGIPFKNFASKELKRSFKELYLVSKYKVNGKEVGGKSSIHNKKVLKANIVVGSIKKSDYNISEIFENKDKLKNKVINVRAKVVKFTPRIMGKNWIHVQDGSGAAGTNDLTITSKETVMVGDVIHIEGTLITNKDFGAGYSYKALLENGKILKD